MKETDFGWVFFSPKNFQPRVTEEICVFGCVTLDSPSCPAEDVKWGPEIAYTGRYEPVIECLELTSGMAEICILIFPLKLLSLLYLGDFIFNGSLWAHNILNLFCPVTQL